MSGWIELLIMFGLPAALVTAAVLLTLARRRQAEAVVETDELDPESPEARSSWRRDLIVATVVIAGASAAAAWKLGHFDGLLDRSHGAIALCEEVLQASLRSPSTYQRISADYLETGPLSLEEYKEMEETSYCGMEGNWQPCHYTNRLMSSPHRVVRVDS